VAPPGNQAANRENKPQPAVFGETGLLDSISSEPINPLLYVVWILTGAFLFFMLLMLIGSVSKKKGGKN
jgi:hypothetical protein